MTVRKRSIGGPKPKPMQRENNGAPYKPTKKDRERVKRLKAYGWTNPEISHYLGISEVSLLNYFEQDLALGRQEKREELELRMERLAKKGYFPAMKYLREVTMGVKPLIQSSVLMLETDANRRAEQAQEIQAEVIEPQGKKLQEQAAAMAPDENTEMGRLMARRQASVAGLNKLN